ncbi:ROK family protein, partial [Clostridioides difficile]|nr:ROK family protein [Clostridioides difficile]
DIIGIGISSIGPVDDINGTILNPPDFGNVSNLNIVDFIKEMSDLPIFLINDANSGALAEKMYGLGKNISNYIYLHIMNGIGAGLVLENKLHTGNLGQSGEIGHTSINFSGPLCSCGNNGCLDYYTSVSNLIKRIESLSHIYPNSPLINCKDFSLVKLIDEANNKDSLAMFLLDEFCTYVSYALVNTLTLIDCSSIIIGYDFNIPGTFIENTLLKKLTASASFSKYKKISVRHSNFGANAPLIGSIAIVSYNFFNGSINFY